MSFLSTETQHFENGAGCLGTIFSIFNEVDCDLETLLTSFGDAHDLNKELFVDLF